VKLATFQAPGASGPLAGEVVEDRVLAFPDGVSLVDVLVAGAAPAPEAEWPLAEVTLLAPIREPGTIYGIGMNYEAHIAEMGNKPPDAPVVFLKARGSVAPPGGPVICPEVVRRLDYEGELAVVMGANGQIGGYCVADDVSARDLQGREPHWARAKGADTFCPFGPWVTTADQVPGVGDLRLRTWVNGELRQDGRTSDLLFGCEELVAFIAQTCTLRPGDLILTGTPSGVGQGLDPPRFLSSGDVVRIEIDELGVIEHPIG
jgi:acylpyruvate hydrolase